MVMFLLNYAPFLIPFILLYLPLILVNTFFVLLYRYLKAKRQMRKALDTVSRDVLHKRKRAAIVFGIIAGLEA